MPEKLLSPTSIKPIPLPSLRLPPLLPLLLLFFGILPPATNSFPITSPMIGQSTNPHANMSLVQEMLLERHSNGDPIFDINGQSELEEHRPEHFEILALDWHHVETPYTVSVWILLASIAKILFHVHKQFGESIPDSALLIVVGLVLGYALQQLQVSYELFTLKSTTFFLYLLPPIIFDAGYFMPNRQLFDNWDSVMLFAFVGTIWNTMSIGFSLYLLGQFQLFSVPFSPFEILLFASLISAVDPVAVIAVFEEIHVNEFLFINVFGEALFNDGVSVVLYQMFRKFTLIGIHNLEFMDYLAGICSFFVIAMGGTLIGLGFAFLVSILTRFTSRVKILAPVFIFVVPYLAYLTAEMFGLSAILAIVACGIMMRQYVKGNLSHDANNSVKYFIKMLAQCSETAIFMFLGLSTISAKHHWDTAFVCITIGLCLLYRTIGVLVQCAVLNRFRNKKFSFTDQFVLCYGGLRGAIAFGLVVSLPALIPAKRMFVTTCIAVIYFTVFLMGITIRPLLYLLKVEKADLDYEAMMVEKVYNKYFDYTMTGIEDIIGQRGRHRLRDAFERLNAKLLKPILMRNVKRKAFDATDIVRAYNKITLHEALKIAHVDSKMKKLVGSSALDSSETLPLVAREAANSSEHKSHQSIASAFRETMNGSLGRTASTKKEIDEYLSSKENTEALYTMFSRLLDRKIEELRRVQESRKQSTEDDIKDNYMAILNTTSQQPMPTSATTSPNRPSNKATSELKQRKITSTSSVAAIVGGRSMQRRRRSQPELGMAKAVAAAEVGFGIGDADGQPNGHPNQQKGRDKVRNKNREAENSDESQI